jgi:exodeoxyribonuclease III
VETNEITEKKGEFISNMDLLKQRETGRAAMRRARMEERERQSERDQDLSLREHTLDLFRRLHNGDELLTISSKLYLCFGNETEEEESEYEGEEEQPRFLQKTSRFQLNTSNLFNALHQSNEDVADGEMSPQEGMEEDDVEVLIDEEDGGDLAELDEEENPYFNEQKTGGEESEEQETGGEGSDEQKEGGEESEWEKQEDRENDEELDYGFGQKGEQDVTVTLSEPTMVFQRKQQPRKRRARKFPKRGTKKSKVSESGPSPVREHTEWHVEALDGARAVIQHGRLRLKHSTRVEEESKEDSLLLKRIERGVLRSGKGPTAVETEIFISYTTRVTSPCICNHIKNRQDLTSWHMQQSTKKMMLDEKQASERGALLADLVKQTATLDKPMIRMINQQAEFSARSNGDANRRKGANKKTVSFGTVSCKTMDTGYRQTDWSARHPFTEISPRPDESETAIEWALADNGERTPDAHTVAKKGTSLGLLANLTNYTERRYLASGKEDKKEKFCVPCNPSADLPEVDNEPISEVDVTESTTVQPKSLRRRKPREGVVVDQLHERYQPAIERWLRRQHDKGKMGVILDALGGQLYRRGNYRNAISLTMECLEDVQQLTPLYDCLLIIGKVEAHHLQPLQALMSGSSTPHFLLDIDYRHTEQFEEFDLFMDQEVRVQTIERGVEGGWDVAEEANVTLSTIPLGFYTIDEKGVPLATTIKGNGEGIKNSWESRIPQRILHEQIPVYPADSVPSRHIPFVTAAGSRQANYDDALISMLGYNCNGIRSSFLRDDWSEILREQPDVLCICEAKCPLWKLKLHAGGDTWAFLRSTYKYTYIFAAKEPNDGMHGTYMFCKNKPDGWIRGMGGDFKLEGAKDSLWDAEGRVCGAIFGKKVVLCTYAKSPKPAQGNLTVLERFWSDYSKFIKSLTDKGYDIQGFGDLNLISHQVLDVANSQGYIPGRGLMTKPGCTAQEVLLIKKFFVKHKLVDYFRKNNPGTAAYTYFQTPGHRERNDGLRLDYIYGTLGAWSNDVDVVTRADVPGGDHLPVYATRPEKNKLCETADEIKKSRQSAVQMLSTLNPKEVKVEDHRRLDSILRTVDKQAYFDAEVIERKKEDGCLKVRKIREIRTTAASNTPYLEFFVNNADTPLYYILDSGADENIISRREAMSILGKDYKVFDRDNPITIEAAWGDAQEATGCVYVPMSVRYKKGEEARSTEAKVRFWVFEDDSTPTLVGVPAMLDLNLGIISQQGKMTATVSEGQDIFLKPLSDPGTEKTRARMVTVAIEVPMIATTDLRLIPGRSIIKVAVGNGEESEYNGAVVMSTAHLLGLNASGQGYIVENNTSCVVEGHAWVSVTVPDNTDAVIIKKGTPINRATILPSHCLEASVVLRGDLAAKKKGDGSCLPAANHLGTGDTSKTAGVRVAAVNTTTTESKHETNDEKETKKTQKETADSDQVDSFFNDPRWSEFQKDGLRLFRPSKAERKRIEDIVVYDEEGLRVDTFGEICDLLLKAQNEYNVVHDKGTQLPIANTEVQVVLKEGAKKVTAGFNQNDLAPAAKQLIQKETNNLVQVGAAEKCGFEDIEYCSRIMLVPKPNGDWRFCVDLRGVNKNVELEHWPLTKVDIRLQGMAGAQFFTTLDLPQAFHNIPLSENSRKYFGFMAPDGLYRYKTLPMGYVNSMALFTRLMDMAMIGLGDMVSVYVDDIIVHSKSWEQHILDLNTVFQRLQKTGLKVNLVKCEFAKSEVPFLGHLVSREGIKMDPMKVAAIDNMELPQDITQLRSFLGATSHYRKFIKDFSQIALPLSELTKKGGSIKTRMAETDCKEAFEQLKASLKSDVVLLHPDLDKQWVLSCDASSYGVACVLQQRINGVPCQDANGKYTEPKNKELRPVAYFSKKLTDSERKGYCIYEKEAYAVVWGLEICKSYIMGSRHPVVVFTDNKALTWLKDSDQPGRLGRWQAQLNMYNMELVHQPATKNRHADGFSRNPIDDVTNAKIPAIRRILKHSIPMSGAEPKRDLDNQQILDVNYSADGERDPLYIVQTPEGLVQHPAQDIRDAAKERYWCERIGAEEATKLKGVNDLYQYSMVVMAKTKSDRQKAFYCKVETTDKTEDDTVLSTLVRTGEAAVRAVTRNQRNAEDSQLLKKPANRPSQDEGESKNNSKTQPVIAGEHTGAIEELESVEQLNKAQRSDRTWGPVITHLKKYSSHWDTAASLKELPTKVRGGMSNLDKQVYSVYKKWFTLDDNGLLRRRKFLKEQGATTAYLTVCVPEKYEKSVLRFHHGTPVSGHLGMNKLKKIMCKRFHWPKMDKAIKRWVNGCAPCQRRKQYRRNNYGLFKSSVSSRPWQRACMDLVGPLPESDDHNVYLLTIVDTFSRWPLAIPLPNKKADTIAAAIYKHLVAVHGCPEELFSDQEATLLSEAVNTMCKNLGIKRITSSCYAPWQNGHVERFHRFLGASLSIYASENKRDWDRWVDCILFTYRVSVHSQTGESPYRIIYNRDPLLGGDLFLNHIPSDDHLSGKSADEITEELFRWFKELSMKQQLLADRYTEKKNSTEKRREPEFKKNDWVLMYEPPVSHRTVKRPWAVPRKFQDVLTGPHRVVDGKANSKGEIKVFHSRRGSQEDIHKSRLVLYNPWSDQLLDTADGSMVPGYDIRSRAQQQQAPSEEVDSKFAYREGDDVKCGEFIIIAVDCDAVHKKPFLIAKIYELGHADGEDAVTADGITYRSVKARIYGNTNDDPTKVHRPGWVDKSNRPYFRVKPEHPSHVPYTTVISHGDVTTYSVILAGFEIDEASEKIPSRVLEALEELWEK